LTAGRDVEKRKYAGINIWQSAIKIIFWQKENHTLPAGCKDIEKC
jgi:hypothetical protein